MILKSSHATVDVPLWSEFKTDWFWEKASQDGKFKAYLPEYDK